MIKQDIRINVPHSRPNGLTKCTLMGSLGVQYGLKKLNFNFFKFFFHGQRRALQLTVNIRGFKKMKLKNIHLNQTL